VTSSMDYLHNSSIPATKSELDVFSVPPTQTAIETYYDVEYHPTTPVKTSKTWDINIPASEDMTDLSNTFVYAKLSIKKAQDAELDITDVVQITRGFASCLFEQVDIFLNGVNIMQASNLYHHQAFIEELLYKPPHPIDAGAGWEADEQLEERSKGQFVLFFRLHSPLTNQDKLLLDHVPILLRFTRNKASFGLIVPETSTETSYHIVVHDLSVHVRRVKVYPDVSLGIASALEKASARYFVTRNETKPFVLSSGSSQYNFEGVFSGILPKRMLVVLISNASLNGDMKKGPHRYEHFTLTQISANVNGFPTPSITYTPDFDKKLCMREFVSLFRYMNQDEDTPQSSLTYDKFLTNKAIFAFDLSPDTTLGSESGTLNLMKRGNIKLKLKFKTALTEVVHMLVLGQFDSLIEIDSARNIKLDY